MKKIKVGVIGGAGYTAGELLRILVNHPNVEIVFVNSSSNAGNPIADVHSGLVGETDLVFTSELPFGEVDALFLCSAHGDSKKFMVDLAKMPHLLVLEYCYRPIAISCRGRIGYCNFFYRFVPQTFYA